MNADQYDELVQAKRKAVRALGDICSTGEASVETVMQAAIALLQFRPQITRVFKSADYCVHTQPTPENRETTGEQKFAC